MSDVLEQTESKPTMSGILWLASYPKSGNTWTRNFLHNLLNLIEQGADAPHDINAMNELTFWEISAAAYERHLGKPPRGRYFQSLLLAAGLGRTGGLCASVCMPGVG